MRCRMCGSKLVPAATDLPFKLGPTTIVILRNLPVHQCESCSEYLLDDPVMARVDKILDQVEPEAELEVIRYAA